MTVVGSQMINRRQAPKRFRKAGRPSLQSGAVQKADGWHAIVVSTWSLLGEELGRERRESAKTYPTSIEAHRAAERMQAQMETSEPVDAVTSRTVGLIRRAASRARAARAVSRIFVANGRTVLPPRAAWTRKKTPA
jgi:hypothetical protein